MSHQPAPSDPRRIPRTLAGLGGLAVCLAAAIGLAPAVQAAPSPPTPSFAPVPPLPPPAAVPAHFPSWAIAAILAATIVLSVATTLITLALERLRWARREAAANPRTPRQQTKPRSLAATPHATVHKHQTGGRRSNARVGERDPQRLPHGITTRHVTRTASADRTGPAGCQRNGWPPEDSKLQRPHRRGQPNTSGCDRHRDATRQQASRESSRQATRASPRPSHPVAAVWYRLSLNKPYAPGATSPSWQLPALPSATASANTIRTVPTNERGALPLPRNRSECLFRVTSEVT